METENRQERRESRKAPSLRQSSAQRQTQQPQQSNPAPRSRQTSQPQHINTVSSLRPSGRIHTSAASAQRSAASAGASARKYSANASDIRAILNGQESDRSRTNENRISENRISENRINESSINRSNTNISSINVSSRGSTGENSVQKRMPSASVSDESWETMVLPPSREQSKKMAAEEAGKSDRTVSRNTEKRARSIRTTLRQGMRDPEDIEDNPKSVSKITYLQDEDEVQKPVMRRKSAQGGTKAFSWPFLAKVISWLNRFSPFKRRLMIYSAALLLILIIGSIVFSIFLGTYEKSLPYNTVESFISKFDKQKDLIAFLTKNAEKTDLLDQPDSLIESYAALAEGKEIGYLEDTNATSDSPAYSILADNEEIAVIKLESKGKGAFDTNKWEISKIKLAEYLNDTEKGIRSYDIVCPQGTKLTVNGTELDDSFILTDDDLSQADIPEIIYSSLEFIDKKPASYTYRINGIKNTPEITASDSEGNELKVISSNGNYVAGYAAPDSFVSSVSGRVEKAVENYALYFIGQSQKNATDIYFRSYSDLFINIFGSKKLGIEGINVEFYDYYGHIESCTFDYLTAENYVKYSDDVFTVDVSYHLNIVFDDAKYSDNNQQLKATWVFVKESEDYDRVWAVAASADFQ